MAKSQQKPKKVAGTRNSERRNGKAFSAATNWNAMEKSGGEWKPKAGVTFDSSRVKPKKPSGKSIMGYRRDRVEKWAHEAGMTLPEYVEMMKVKRAQKKYETKLNREAFARLIKGAESLYRDGTLVHKSMPRIAAVPS